MRFVVIPAVPTDKETFPRRLGFPSALGEGYDLYDTHDKIRLTMGFPTRAEAEFECCMRNDLHQADKQNLARSG